MSWLSEAGKKLDRWAFGRGPRTMIPPDIAPLRGDVIGLLRSFMNNPDALNNFFFSGPLQRQGIGVQQFLSGPSPEMRAFDTARPILEGMLTGMGPQFERDIAMANSQGGRFGSANAIMRGEALRNLFNMRTQTAGTLGALAGQAGESQFNRLFQFEQQRAQLLAALLGMSGQASLSPPIDPGSKGAFGDIFGSLAAVFGSRGGGGGGGNA